MPRPSTGCLQCRQRHVKCDETKPDCHRCLRLGRPCPGYRDTCGVIIQDVTAKIQAKYQRQRLSYRPSPTLASIPGAIPDDGLASSVHFLFTEYIKTPSLLRRPYFEYLPQMYHASDTNSALASAVTFTAARAARLHFGNQIKPAILAECGSKALQAIQAAIVDSSESVRDETLLAVLCLDFAEHLASRSESMTASRAHVNGALLLVQHRRAQSFANPVSASLVIGTTSIVLLSALWSQPSASQTLDAVDALPEVDASHQGPYAELHQLLSRALRLEGRMIDHNSVKPSMKSPCSEAKTLVAAQELDSDMDWWLQSLPLNWQSLLAQPRTPPSILSSASDAGMSTLEMTFILGQWHCTKLTTLRLLYAAVTAQCPEFPGGDLVCADILARAQSTANSICNVVSVIADTPPLSSSKAHRMERGLSGLMPSKTGSASDWRGGTMDGKHCCLNILRWVLSILVDEKDSVPGFEVDQGTTEYLKESMRVVQNAFSG